VGTRCSAQSDFNVSLINNFEISVHANYFVRKYIRMMDNRLKTFNCLVLVIFVSLQLFSINSSAQYNKVSFQTLLDDSGPGEILEFYQDKQGYMWLGAYNALLRYDAYEFKEFFIVNGLDSESLGAAKSPDKTTCLFQDSLNQLWLAAHSGLFIFDENREIFVRVKSQNGEVETLFSENVHSVVELSTGEILVGLTNGIALIDKTSFSVERIFFNQILQQNANNSVYDIVIDKKQNIWLGTQSGLMRFNYDEKSISHFIPDPSSPGSHADNQLWSLEIDDFGNLWGGTLGGGLFKFDTTTKKFKRYRKNSAISDTLPEDTIWDITRDSQGMLWLAHDRTGISKLNPATEVFEHYYYPLDQPGSLLYNTVKTIYEDKIGDLWVGHYPAGVSFHDKSSAAIVVHRDEPDTSNSLTDKNIQAVMEDAQGDLWVATGKGVSFLNWKTGKFKNYNNGNGKYLASGTLSGYIDTKGRVWIGTWSEGYHRYNPETDAFDSMPVDAKLASDPSTVSTKLHDATIWSFCETKKQGLWIGTHNAGISNFNQSDRTFTKYYGKTNNEGLTNRIAWSCFEDSRGRFWVGTAWGVNILDPSTGEVKRYLPSETDPNALQSGAVVEVYEDSMGQIWLGTLGGLHLYQEETDNFKVFSKKEGLILNGVRGITEDRYGWLWLGTNKGIVRFNPQTYELKNYLSHGGRKFGGVNTGAAMTNKQGDIMFGTVDGLVIIDPDKLTINNTPPTLVLKDFKILTNSVPVNGPENILTTTINRTNSITLDHTKRMFSFEFSALNFRSSNKNQYAYKLEGFDDTWHEVGTQRKAQYTNLDSGLYTFKVKASNNDGVWSNTEKSIVLRQLPPPWETWWAYTLYALTIFALLANIFYSQRNRRRLVEKQNKVLEIKVAERTADLAAKNNDIQALLSNIQQGLFTIDASGLIHHEYSAHVENIFETQEIAGQNSLEFILARAQISSDVKNQVEASISSMLGEDPINYEFNRHLLIKECNMDINGKVKTLSIDWNPIIEDDTTVKLMVTMRDISKLKALELASEEQKRELEIVGQLVNSKAKKIKKFFESAKAFIDESRDLIKNSSSGGDKILAALFRSMHTIKGNSRTHGFTYISDNAHNVESVYNNIKRNQALWNQKQLLQNLDTIEACLLEYHAVYSGVLGRGDENSRDSNGSWFDESIIKGILASAEEIKNDRPENYVTIKNLIDQGLSTSLSEALSDILNSLPSIADDLGKAHPHIDITDNNIGLRAPTVKLVGDVFSHLLRNAMDHGIEAPSEREIKSKEHEGLIIVCMNHNDDCVKIKLKDDGKGINVTRLFTKGVTSGKWTEKDKPLYSAIIALIFESGVSTKEAVSNISGRGVGMDAVKQFLVQAGGDIYIETSKDNQCFSVEQHEEYIAFQTTIDLPVDCFVLKR